MDKILIISNVRHKELGKFIERRGAFEVSGCYNSISANVVDIQSKILDVNKTLYLYQPDEGATNIRADMQIFQNMLNNNGFFKPGEIIFITQATPQCKQAEKYFVTVMNSCNYHNYLVKKIPETISFTSVYDTLMGLTSNADFKNSFRTFYRTERDVETSAEYEQQNDSDLLIEPYSFEALDAYKSQVKLLQGMTSAIEFRDDADTQLPRYDRLSLGNINLHNVLQGPKVVLMTGKSKSGLSTWASALAVSATKESNNTLVLDYTVNNDVSFHFNQGNVKYTDCRVKQILEGRNSTGGLNLCEFKNDREQNIRFNFIKNIFCDKKLAYDVVIIPVDIKDFAKLFEMLKSDIFRVFITTMPRYSDVAELVGYVDLLESADVFVIMNNCLRSMNEELLEQEQVKAALELMDVKVVASCWFKTVDVGTNLCKMLLGGGSDDKRNKRYYTS